MKTLAELFLNVVPSEADILQWLSSPPDDEEDET